MVRRIIHIDEEKCNGCGACAAACHEGAIGMVNGKARLMRDDYCDGLGDCLPACPTGARRKASLRRFASPNAKRRHTTRRRFLRRRQQRRRTPPRRIRRTRLMRAAVRVISFAVSSERRTPAHPLRLPPRDVPYRGWGNGPVRSVLFP